MQPEISDIVERLRAVWEQPFAIDADPRAMLLKAADEIERLRSLVRFQDRVIRSGDTAVLTDAEREAIAWMLRHAAYAADVPAFPDSGDYRLHHDALLARLK